MGTMHSPASVPQISFFRCILRRQFFYPASATATATATATAAATTTTATTTITRVEPLSTATDSLSTLANFLVGSLEFSTQQALSTSIKLTKWRQSRRATKWRQSRRATKDGILYISLDSTIRPAVEALSAIMGSNENVVRVIKRFRLNTLPLVTKHLVCNVSLLQARGIPIESIQKRILQHSAAFIRKPEVFKDIMARAEAKWGVSPRSTMFLYAVHVLGCLNEKNIESKCRVFESFGWDRSDVVDLFRHNPYSLGMSEEKIKATMKFFMNKLGYDPGFISAYPILLCYSLEKRVLPRHQVLQLLKDKGLIGEKLAFYRAVSMSESQFLRRCIRPFEDDVPNLHDIYVNSIGSSAKRQIKRAKNTHFSRKRLVPDSA